jgi:hypothetical protein
MQPVCYLRRPTPLLNPILADFEGARYIPDRNCCKAPYARKPAGVGQASGPVSSGLQKDRRGRGGRGAADGARGLAGDGARGRRRRAGFGRRRRRGWRRGGGSAGTCSPRWWNPAGIRQLPDSRRRPRWCNLE